MKDVEIVLSRNDVGQLLDGIEVLIEQWEATADYLSNGTIREDVCIRESCSADESTAIASTYRDIRDRIREQLVVMKQ